MRDVNAVCKMSRQELQEELANCGDNRLRAMVIQKMIRQKQIHARIKRKQKQMQTIKQKKVRKTVRFDDTVYAQAHPDDMTQSMDAIVANSDLDKIDSELSDLEDELSDIEDDLHELRCGDVDSLISVPKKQKFNPLIRQPTTEIRENINNNLTNRLQNDIQIRVSKKTSDTRKKINSPFSEGYDGKYAAF